MNVRKDPHHARTSPDFLVEPVQLVRALQVQAVVVRLARKIIQRVPQEVHVATLPGRVGQHLTLAFPVDTDRCLHRQGSNDAVNLIP